MQVGRASFVAAGALATVAVMGSAAAAAPVADTTQLDGATAATTLAIDDALRAQKVRDVARTNDRQARPLISIGTGSNVTAAAWQICGSTAVAGAGVATPVDSGNTVTGNCANANTILKQDHAPGLISILDDSAINVAPWQICGSNVVAGAGATAAANSPNLVTGDCANANTFIKAPDGNGQRLGDDELPLVSVLSGSVLTTAAWQACGSTVSMGAGVASGVDSPTAVLGDCWNAGVVIQDRERQAEIPLLSNLDLNLAPLQFCGDDDLLSLGGVAAPLRSDGFVGGRCYSPQVLDVS